jgi:hypothetical protein
MTTRRVSFRQADAARALRAAVAAGLRPSGYTIGVDGSITVNLGAAEAPKDNSFDQIMRQAK